MVLHILAAGWYNIAVSSRSCLHNFPADHHIIARRIRVRIASGMEPSNWFWYAPRIIYSINYGAEQYIGFSADGLSAEYVGFTADSAECVGIPADGSVYCIGSAADGSTAVCIPDSTCYTHRSVDIATAPSGWHELGVS